MYSFNKVLKEFGDVLAKALELNKQECSSREEIQSLYFKAFDLLLSLEENELEIGDYSMFAGEDFFEDSLFLEFSRDGGVRIELVIFGGDRLPKVRVYNSPGKLSDVERVSLYNQEVEKIKSLREQILEK